jgi:hypothetical protein
MNEERQFAIDNCNGNCSVYLGAHGDQPGGTGIELAHAVDGAVIRGCTVTNFGHSAIDVLYKDATNVAPGVSNVTIEGNDLTAGSSSYCRALGFGGPEKIHNVVVRRNYCHDQNIVSQFGGTQISSTATSGT